MDITVEDLYTQEYLGKVEITALLRDNDLIKGCIRTESCSDMAARYNRFLERVTGKTEHEVYMKKVVEKLVSLLDSIGEGNCIEIDCPFDPNLLYGLYIHVESGSVLAAIKGYDIQKTTPEDWEKIWG